MTVGSAVTLTFVGIAYWMIPYLTGRRLWSRRAALASSWIYAIGLLVFARGMISAGIEGLQVDGNDVIAVRHAMDQALAKARSGRGPTLIEAVTYRLSDHTTADDASRYRSPDELAEAWKREPLVRLRTYLAGTGAWDKAREDALLKECNEQVQAAAQAYLDTPPPTAGQMFDHLYATPPAALQKQRAAALGDDS